MSTSTIKHLDAMVLQLLQQTPEAILCVHLESGLLLRSTIELWVNIFIVATVTLLRREATSASFDWYELAKK